MRCSKRKDPVVIDENKICSASQECDGILNNDAVEYILRQNKDLPPELSGPTGIITGERRCTFKRYDD